MKYIIHQGVFFKINFCAHMSYNFMTVSIVSIATAKKQKDNEPLLDQARKSSEERSKQLILLLR